ncbi:hypothetical protein HPB48_016892 [Haemaphysalis longicornis]|uniref:Uncharacterized protein n=1 Tax=Haemaphysalis longicornis TaxID=44386 RepID=A0A9J6G335_HAELO|nr:hypothetical protein HPB48_016892 [Haemaphysalis longicornis]
MDGYTCIKGKLAGKFGFKVNCRGEVCNPKQVHCLQCKKVFTYCGSASSLQYHLRAKHPGQPLQQESSQKTQTTIDAYTARSLSTTKEESIAQALVTWIVSSSRPLSIVEDHGLATVLRIASSSPCYQPPSRRAVGDRVDVLYNRKKSDVQAELSTASFIIITADF